MIVNTLTNKSYIGKSINVESRWKSHISNLKNNKHRLPESAYIYADSSWRNQQMNKIREIILKIK
jgi:hypothetical protein